MLFRSVAVHVNPEVLLVDEVLAVGDQGFTHKCLDKFAEFRRRNKSILLVTHSLDLVEKFCDVAHWLDHGVTKGEGDPKRIVAAYIIDVEDSEENELAKAEAARVAAAAKTVADPAPSEATAAADLTELDASTETGEGPATDEPQGPKDGFKSDEGRWGTREVEITKVTISGPDGDAGHVFQSGDPIQVRMDVHAKDTITDFVFGLGLFNADNVCVYGTNTNLEEFKPTAITGSGSVTFLIDHLDLVEGTYRLDLAAHKADGYPYDYHRLLYTFRVKSRIRDVGIYRPDHHWLFEGGITLSNQ